MDADNQYNSDGETLDKVFGVNIKDTEEAYRQVVLECARIFVHCRHCSIGIWRTFVLQDTIPHICTFRARLGTRIDEWTPWAHTKWSWGPQAYIQCSSRSSWGHGLQAILEYHSWGSVSNFYIYMCYWFINLASMWEIPAYNGDNILVSFYFVHDHTVTTPTDILFIPTLCCIMTHSSHTLLHSDSSFPYFTPLWLTTPTCTFTIYTARSPPVFPSLVLLKYTWVLAEASEPLSSSWK